MLKKSQILVLSLLAALIVIAPFLSSSLRPTYLYFVLNFLIISLGAEAGLLSVFFKSPDQENRSKQSTAYTSVAAKAAPVTTQLLERSPVSDDKKQETSSMEKSSSEKINVGAVMKAGKAKKSPSTPSLFFIGSGELTEAVEDVAEEYEEEEEEEEVAGLSGQELFDKSENFIGNFYKHLKMQRENSWKRIHGFYQKAF